MASSASNSKPFECPICLEYTSANSEDHLAVSTPCGHVFHGTCITRYLNCGNRCCPVCRDPVNKVRRLYGIEAKSPTKPSDNNNGLEIPDYSFKIVLLGSSSVGKSSLLKRFTDGVFEGNLVATTGCDVGFRMMSMGGKQIKLNIWDTVGQEKFQSVATNVVRNAHGVMLVYDVTDSSSLSAVDTWLEFVNTNGRPEAIKILVGNKVDVDEEERMIAQRQGKSVAMRMGVSFFETSAKESNNVEAAFRCLVGEIMESTVLNPEFENHPVSNNIHLRLQIGHPYDHCPQTNTCFCLS